MAVIDVYNLQKEKTAQIELRDDIFLVPVKKHILHQVVVSQLLRRRSGTASAKGRSEVNRSGKKLYRQKGTGRARAGDAASPTRKGGGVTFGPAPRQYEQKIPKKLGKLALRMALSDKFKNERLLVVNEFNLAEAKTKQFAAVMKGFEVRKALIVTPDKNEGLERSSRNMRGMKVMRCEGLNVYDVLNYDHLFLVQSAIPKIEEALIS
ncbi:MAG: 50S ribosomal protein L4 [Desulfobacterota bacterium]|jgi:large subunit ribosomal protein L4|nr:50S ribosomal protein L4 [Thermodesulfobacteriota bacterium]